VVSGFSRTKFYNAVVPGNIRRDIGQLLIGSVPGTTITAEIRSLAREFSLGGVILFARNIEAPEQVAELSIDVQTLAGDLPLWVSVDQEGGRVARLKAPFTEWPPMAVLGRSGDEQLAARFAGALATELRAVGITLDYAPVLDIHTNPKNPVIGDRALAEDAESVARLGAAIIGALQQGGVAACGKHFPGHGDTSVDSHLELPLVEHPPDRIRRVECVPFREAIRADVAFIMTAHVLVPSFDEQRPATLSPPMVQGLLRDELGFPGVILSDDLEMKAIAKTYTVPDAAVAAIAAGCDGLLVCSGDVEAQAATLEALVHAVENEKIPYKRLEDALTRLRRAKERFLAAPVASRKMARIRQVLGCDAHQRIVDEMARYL
jgi:beta-N-acetylhexosaminidase